MTRCDHHVTVIPITPLNLTTIGNITGRMVVGRVVNITARMVAGGAVNIRGRVVAGGAVNIRGRMVAGGAANIRGRMVIGRVAEFSGDASTRAGLAVPPRRRSRRRCRALTFHRCNVLLKTPAGPSEVRGLLGRGESTSMSAWHAEFIPFVRRLRRA